MAARCVDAIRTEGAIKDMYVYRGKKELRHPMKISNKTSAVCLFAFSRLIRAFPLVERLPTDGRLDVFTLAHEIYPILWKLLLQQNQFI